MDGTSVRVAVRVRPLLDSEKKDRCAECIRVISNESQVSKISKMSKISKLIDSLIYSFYYYILLSLDNTWK